MSKSQSPTSQLIPTMQSQKQFRSAYDPQKKVTITFTGSGRTKQQFKDECDINHIMARFQQTGLLDFVNRGQPQYIDVTGHDYQNAMLTIANANTLFQQMPSALRAEFNNSPQEFVEFCENPANAPRMAELGLTEPQQQNQGAGIPAPASTQPTPQSANPQAPATAQGT
jgi:phage internal scaffolding protein